MTLTRYLGQDAERAGPGVRVRAALHRIGRLARVVDRLRGGDGEHRADVTREEGVLYALRHLPVGSAEENVTAAK